MAVDRRAAEAPKNDRTDLEVWLRVKGPDFLRRNLANILLAVAVIVAVVVFLQNRRRGREVAASAASQNVAAAFDSASRLRAMNVALANDAAARERQQLGRDALAFADVALASDAATPAQKALALLCKADVYWSLASLPESALATTQPIASFTTRPAGGYLDDAEEAYKDLLGQYPDGAKAAGPALLALAAINEERGKFDDAAQWYQRALDEKAIDATLRDVAKGRLAMLPKLRTPLLLAAPATRAAATGPATQPTAQEPSASTSPAIPPLLARPASTQP